MTVIDEIRAREAAATPGPWGWRGHLSNSIELRTLHSGGMRIISTHRSEPCTGVLQQEERYGPFEIVLLDNACASCTKQYGLDDYDERLKCEKPENLDTIWVWDRKGAIVPINRYGKAEVLQWSEHMYRDDVKDTTHPDAEFIAQARTDIPLLLAEIDRLAAQIFTKPTLRSALGMWWRGLWAGCSDPFDWDDSPAVRS